jgi:hypothetical protein
MKIRQTLDSMNPFDEHTETSAHSPWPSPDANLLASDDDWWVVACMDWPRDRWLGYVGGYWKGAEVIAAHITSTGRDQDYLVYPFLMCWRHYVELQIKILIGPMRIYRRETIDLPRTHKIDHLWRTARPLLDQVSPGDRDTLDNTERVLLQLHGFDPTSEHFRYPVRKDGTETLTTLGRVHVRRFHEAMDGVAHFLDAADTGIRAMTDARAEYEEAMRDRYGVPD